MAISLPRIEFQSDSLACKRFLPNHRMAPPYTLPGAGTRPNIAWQHIDLPDPDSPRITRQRPFNTVNDTSLTTLASPLAVGNPIFIFSNFRIGSLITYFHTNNWHQRAAGVPHQ